MEDISKLKEKKAIISDKISFSNLNKDFQTSLSQIGSLINVNVNINVVSDFINVIASASTTITFTKAGSPFSFDNTNYAFIMNDNGAGIVEISRTISGITLQIPVNTDLNYIAIL